ncbi:MAG TPA: enoyl-CoA hydratase/isomerase family protein [Solirubrobacteraceae bacterium]|nr:enoyl-CoA hydratase/isomerase family protein [Solirubrobacteraceae bacterium]
MSSTVESPLLVRREGAVAWVWLNRADRRNAISAAMRSELSAQLAELNADDSVRVAVLTGTGSAFCAGVDLTEQREAPPHVDALVAEPVALPVEQFEKPILAAINGPAVGGGLELALAADMRVASTAATFALPEVKLGSLPGSGGTQRLIRAMSPAVASKALFTGEPFDATEALRAGLVSDVFEPDELIAATEALAAKIAANAPLSLRAAKLALRTAWTSQEGLALERALWGLLSVSADRAEGRAAFRERRPPRFTGS